MIMPMFRLKLLWNNLLRLLKKDRPDPRDPYADKLAPVRKGPPGRSGAVALAEPEE